MHSSVAARATEGWVPTMDSNGSGRSRRIWNRYEEGYPLQRRPVVGVGRDPAFSGRSMRSCLLSEINDKISFTLLFFSIKYRTLGDQFDVSKVALVQTIWESTDVDYQLVSASHISLNSNNSGLISESFLKLRRFLKVNRNAL